PSRAAEVEDFGNDDTAGVIAVAVDAVGIRGERVHARLAVELERERRSIFSVAAAAATSFTEHDARFAAGQDGRALAGGAHSLGEPRMLAPERLRFVVEIVAEL